MSFVDEAQVHVKAGDGGAGAISFRREAHVAKGGPDGGDGGDGGSIWLVADRNVASLYGFRDHPHRRAGRGIHGMGKGRHGKAGADLDVPVPEGTVVRDAGGDVVADLVVEGDRWLAARGGEGGRGNARFLSNRRRAPSFAEQAEVGEERWLDLELKLMADVALVGFPNSGKSTLISRISAARPKIADYPFTTLEPHLGVVRFENSEFVVADIPGLIEGASAGRGLGHRFLRHIERSRVLVVLLDLTEPDGRSPADQERVLLEELRRHHPDLVARPRLAVGSKADAAPAAGGWAGERISAWTGEGLRPLLGRMAVVVGQAREELFRPPRFVVHRPQQAGVAVERASDGGWVVVGRAALRAVALSDLTNAEALAYAQGRLRRLGVDRALNRAGVRAGERVRIGDFEFEYQPDDDMTPVMIGPGQLIVAKIGTSSLTDRDGAIVPASIEKLCAEVAVLRAAGHRVVVVSSGAISAGLPILGLHEPRPTDPAVLQAVSAVGQAHLIDHYNRALAAHGLIAGQVLLAPLDFVNRQQYLHARQTLSVLLGLGVVPVVNENDAIADDEIRFGDNDRIAALVSHLLAADLLVLLTDTPGLLTANPKVDRDASLIEEIVEVDHEMEALAGGTGSVRGSGGMASKLAAAKMAAWSGVRVVIAAATRPHVLRDAAAGVPGVGTVVIPRPRRLPARKLWIAFAVGSAGTVVVDEGARTALVERGVSLLPAGVVAVEGSFEADAAVEIAGPDGQVFAKGLARHPAHRVKELAGRRTSELPDDVAHEVVHRDDLVLLP